MPVDLTIDPALPVLRKQLIRMAAYRVSGRIVVLANNGKIGGLKPFYRMKRDFVSIPVDYQRELTPAEDDALAMVALMIPELWERRFEVKNAQIVLEVVDGVPQPDFDWEPYLNIA